MAEFDIQYEYVNRMSAYRDALYAHFRDRSSEIQRYRQAAETGPPGIGRPGGPRGVEQAESVWDRLPEDTRAAVTEAAHDPNCRIEFIYDDNGQLGGRHSSTMPLHQYLVTRLDLRVMETLQRMAGDQSGNTEGFEGLAENLAELKRLTRAGQLDVYRPDVYLLFEP